MRQIIEINDALGECKKCVHFHFCEKFCGAKKSWKRCDFFPSRFKEKSREIK